jgi:hypothetical protein
MIFDATSRIILEIRDGGATNLSEPLDSGFVKDKHGSGPHDKASEGKGDGCCEDVIGAWCSIG